MTQVHKQEAEAEWQEFATPAAALRHVKAEGAPSTLQQVQIECAAKNSKPRKGFEFSSKPPTAASPQQPPQSQATSPPTMTQSIGSFVQVLSSSYCSSCRGKLCGVTSSCPQCKRGVHEHCFVVVEGEGHRWCFACSCGGVLDPYATILALRILETFRRAPIFPLFHPESPESNQFLFFSWFFFGGRPLQGSFWVFRQGWA